MPSPAGYEPLPQHAEEDEETVNGGPDPDHIAKPSHRQALKRPFKPGHIDLRKLDNAFKRCGGRLPADLNLTSCQVDRIHCAKGETEEESRGPFAQGDMAECL